MSQLPTGTVTFLFTDIEGSTERWERFPAAMNAALERHDELLRRSVAEHEGVVFKTVGDAVCAAFRTASGALDAALGAQRAIAGEDWARFGEGFEPVRVRMGLHTGAAHERDGDYFGPPLNRCARLEAAGHGGQILLSLASHQLLRDKLDEGVALRDLGEHRLKDLVHSEHIFQVVAEGLPDITTPPRTVEQLHVGDRIVLDAEAAGRSLPEAMAALLEVVRDDEASVVFSQAQLSEIADHAPSDLRTYRLSRIAEWSQPRYRVDGRFVALELLIDQGEDALAGRWVAAQDRYDDLGALLAAAQDPALVVLGPPGAGKSTILRRYELDAAVRALKDDDDPEGPSDAPIPFFVALNHYKPDRPGGPLPAPGEWLEARWNGRYPEMPSLKVLLSTGRMVLLLDALNEMSLPSEAAYSEAVGLWKAFVQDLHRETPRTRVVFSCRSLDYSQPLSTPALRVPQIRIEPLADHRVREFLQVYSPAHWREIWGRLEASPQLEVLRSPYFLKLLTEQVDVTGEMPEGRAGLFTGFVRQALRREVELGNPLFLPDGILSSRDVRRITQWKWKRAVELPERGLLVPKLSGLAREMQEVASDHELSQVRVDLDDALDMLDDDRDEDLVRAGVAIGVLDEDPAADELMYVHQLVQEYFAARSVAKVLDTDVLATPWRADEVTPDVAAVIDGLDPADPLPGLPQTGWEETTLLAAAIAKDPSAFVERVAEANLVLAGRCAAQSEVRPALPDAQVEGLAEALVARSRDPEADLRARIAAGQVAGELGDPRFERARGPEGDEALLPPLVEIPAGRYPIGTDEPIATALGEMRAQMPAHEVALPAFQIARFPVTNREYALFLDAGGYDDERWWDTAAARAWRLGETTAAGVHFGVRNSIAQTRARPEIMDQYLERGVWDEEIYERGQRRVRMTEEELEAHLGELYPNVRFTEPVVWRDERFHGPAQPVVGVSWYEARAYTRWLASQTGRPYRLPTEAEWEAAARGPEGRVYAYGDRFARRCGNTSETHVRRTTPIGVFPEGDTPEGVADLTGNVLEWTSSALGTQYAQPEHGYPYDPADGREQEDVDDDRLRVLRGGGWSWDAEPARAAFRNADPPAMRTHNYGFRLALSP